MPLSAAACAVATHTGEFDCVAIRSENNQKVVEFRHETTPATGGEGATLPDVGRLREVYETFGAVIFYFDPISGDSARRLAPPSEWRELAASFGRWVDDLSEAEWLEFLPAGASGEVLVIGETPHSGNYVLMPTAGELGGHVFEFDHDGFECIDVADDLEQYLERMLKPDAARLTDFASHMRFMMDDEPGGHQWWIKQMRDTDGRVVQTAV